MARRKYCGVAKAHQAHTWSQDDLSENEMFRCSGVKPVAVGDPVYTGNKKLRVISIGGGRVILGQHGRAMVSIEVELLEFDRVPGLWRPKKGAKPSSL